MPDLLALSVELGGYVSIIKLVIFLALFFPLLPALCWIYNDAQILENRSQFWITLILSIAAAAIIIWLVVPFFIIGVLFYAIAVGSLTYAYIKGRNALVIESEKVLTPDHIKGLFKSGDGKKLKEAKDFIFITANKNEVPVPEPKTPDFHGYKITHDLFSDALYRRVSNIIFLPGQDGYTSIFYIDGIAVKQPPLPKEQADYFIRFIKQLGNLDINEKRKPQKGKFKIRKDKEDYEWEIITAGSTAGEHVQFNKKLHENLTRLEDLGLPADQLQQLAELRGLNQGVFIVTGPRKSGLTTTFYALLRNHDSYINNIHTLEKEKSGELPNITQEIFSPSDTTIYARKLETIIRMGPEIVGVADCTDKEAAKLCCKAARDNKLVYVSMEADSVMNALSKWIQMVEDGSASIGTLIGITNQRLVRKLCDECKEAYTPDPELLKKFNIPKDSTKAFYRAGKFQYDKKGRPTTCTNCQGTGYVGRIAILEVIRVNDQLRKSIMNLKTLSDIARQFRAAKMLYLQEQMLKRVLAGVTSINEMVRVLSKQKAEEKK